MPEETFRIVVAAAVAIACLAFVVQAGVVLALFRLTRKMQEKTAGFMEVAEPVLARVEPVLDQVGPVIERIGPALDAINDTAGRLGPAIDRFLPVIDKTIVIVQSAGVLVQSANQATMTANQLLQDARPRVVHISDETLAIVRAGREQVERAGAFIQSAKQMTGTANQILQDVRPRIVQISEETAAIPFLETRFSLPTDRREFPEKGRRRERHHFRRWWADRPGPKRPPRADTHRARDRAWHAYYNSGNGAGTGHSNPRQAGPPLPANSTGWYGPYSAGRTGRDGCRPIVGTNRDGRHRRCPRRHLCAEGRAGRGNQRR